MTVNTILINMPVQIKGYTIKNEDDSYSIFLNARMASNQIEKTFEHEIEHIKNEDFEKEQVQRIEAYTHGLKCCDKTT